MSTALSDVTERLNVPISVFCDAVNQAYVAVVRDAIKTTTITTVEIIKPFFFIVFSLSSTKPLSKNLMPYMFYFFCFQY